MSKQNNSFLLNFNQRISYLIRFLLLLILMQVKIGSTQIDSTKTPFKISKSKQNDPNREKSSNIDLNDPINTIWKYNPKLINTKHTEN